MFLEEGIIKFRQEFRDKLFLESKMLGGLNFWRDVLYKEGLIGRDSKRYNGFGFGNVSQRLEPYQLPVNKRRFVITGSQTGHLPVLTARDYTVVYEYYPEKNLVMVGGLIRASSESMTHGAIYDLDDSIRFVFHLHSPHIWKNSEYLGIPTARENAECGTPEMAEEVFRLYRETNLRKIHLFSMGGHEDGIFSFGRSSKEAGHTLLRYLSVAKKLTASQ